MKHTIIILALLFMLAGCHQQARKEIVIKTPEMLRTNIITEAIYKTNKTATIYFLVIAIGIYLSLTGAAKIGAPLAISAGITLAAMAVYQSFATHLWLPTVFGVAFLTGGVAYLTWREYNRFKSMKAAVMYAELKKNNLSPEKTEELKKLQTKPVNKIIEEVKSTI